MVGGAGTREALNRGCAWGAGVEGKSTKSSSTLLLSLLLIELEANGCWGGGVGSHDCWGESVVNDVTPNGGMVV